MYGRLVAGGRALAWAGLPSLRASESKCLAVTLRQYAGHAKWQNIMFVKGRADARKMTDNNKAAMQLAAAIRKGNGETDPKLNSHLASTISVVKAKGVPRGIIDKAIKGYSTTKPQSENIYEVVSPQGVSFVVVSLTENQLRTLPQIKMAVKDYDLKFTNGSVLYRFPKKGIICVREEDMPKGVDPEEVAISVGAEDIILTGDGYELRSDPAELASTVKALASEYSVKPASFAIGYVPIDTVEVAENDREAVSEIMEKLEDAESVISVFSDVA